MIAVKDGAILWSWHIWYPEAEVAGLNSKTGYEVMNMNLGAMHNTPGDVGSYGLLYQWGRKDPFPAAPTLTGTTATVGAPIYDGDDNEIKITNSPSPIRRSASPTMRSSALRATGCRPT